MPPLALNTLAAIISSAFSPAPQLLLDLYPGAAVAFSTRKLSSSYLGPCVRVRRSSDNAELDIYFSSTPDANGSYWIDEAALLAFVGAGNGFVTNWYDQSGFGANFIITTAVQQPRIVISGIVNKTNGGDKKPSQYIFSGSRLIGTNSLSKFKNVPYIGAFCVYERTSGSGTHTIFFSSIGTASLTRFGVAATLTSINTTGRRLDTDSISIDSSTISSGLTQVTGENRYSEGLIESFNKGTSDGSSNMLSSGNTQNTDSFAQPIIGVDGAGGNAMDGCLPELVVYTTSQVANRAAIIANQMAVFGVTP